MVGYKKEKGIQARTRPAFMNELIGTAGCAQNLGWSRGGVMSSVTFPICSFDVHNRLAGPSYSREFRAVDFKILFENYVITEVQLRR
jgi:hypothetical protein